MEEVNMRKLLLFILALCNFTYLFSQESFIPWLDLSKVVHEKADSSTYFIGYNKNNGRKYIGNTYDPFCNESVGRVGTGPWQGNVSILPSSINYQTITKEVLAPYYKETDSCSIYIAACYDLKGDFQKFELSIPKEVNIPIKVIEKLENRLRKETKLKLEYEPEKAKYINYITLSTYPLQEWPPRDIPLKTEYERTNSNLYVIDYYDSKVEPIQRKFISNTNNPYKGIGTRMWQGSGIKILSSTTDEDTIIKDTLAPYWKSSDWSDLYTRFFYDLNGDLQHLEISIPAEMNIPIEIFEKLENRLKKESKLILEYDPEKVKYVNYIVIAS